MYKSFKEIVVDETEEQYREDGAYHYSTLASYDRGGFNCIPTLFSKKETPSLLFGSAVDTLLTDGRKAFDERFAVLQVEPERGYEKIIKALYNKYGKNCSFLHAIPESEIIKTTEEESFFPNWRPETRVKLIIEKGSSYYGELLKCDGKQFLDKETYDAVLSTCSALRKSPATEFFFRMDNPFDNIERLYQLKFYGTVSRAICNSDDGEDINQIVSSIKTYSGKYPIGLYPVEDQELAFSCMADLIVCDHAKKKVYPCDLKTSGHKEWEFYTSFLQWCYQIQARLYWRLIRATMNASPDFKDYELMPYTFIVVNKDSQTPLTWSFESTKQFGDLAIGEHTLREPFKLALELDYYLKTNTSVPIGINEQNSNSLEKWISSQK